MSSAAVYVYEAMCSAFYQMSFTEFLGETDSPVPGVRLTDDRGRTAWFHVGERPKDVRVSICLASETEVVVKSEWRNYFTDGRHPLKGEHVGRVSLYGASQADVEAATEAAIVRVLEIYTEVLSETGVAGKLSELVEDAESETE